MKSLSKIIVIFFATISCLYVTAQKTGSVPYEQSTQPPSEKIYIHYDKEYYVAGETIWFKAYLYSSGLPSSQSNNFYLQLINGEGKIISSKKYPVKGATVKGNIDLPDSIRQGFYHIRALTPGMLNANQDLFYSKNIFVYNPSDKLGSTFSVPGSNSLSIRFFPESGFLVDGVLSVLAFKAVDSSGMPVAVNGILKMDDSVNLAPFTTYHDGIGKVQLKPQYGKKYLAAITYNGHSNFFPLPEVQPSGINLSVEDEKGGKMFLLSRSKKDKDIYNNLVVVAEMNHMNVYEQEINFESYLSVKGHLLTDSLPSGILHFTVFDKEGKPLAERLTFVNNGEYDSKGKIEIVKNGTGVREENIVEVNFPDQAQRSFSVAVTDAETSSPVSPENIITKFLLTDELKGYIDNPAWYFQDKTDTIRQAALDNLMLTHGWSRFLWNKIPTKVPEKKYSDNYLISVSGKLDDSKNNGSVSGGVLSIFMESEDSVNHNFDITVGSDGKFTIDSLLFYGKARFYYAYKTTQGKEIPVNITLDPQPIDRVVDALPYSMNEGAITPINSAVIPKGAAISKRYQSGASSVTETKELKPVMVQSKNNKRPIDEVNDSYTSGLFTAMGKMNFDNINEPENDRSISVFDFIKRSVKHVIVEDDKFVNRKNFSLFSPASDERYAQKKNSDDSLRTLMGLPALKEDEPFLMSANGHDPGKHFEVAIFVNESPAYAGLLKTIRMSEVALLKFYDPGFIGAGSAQGPGGAISVYTKKDISPPGNIDKLDHIVYNGYSLTKEFYSPDYSMPVQQNMEQDLRTTLFWNPELYTDNSSKNTILKFYNNDFSKKLKIVAEGFDANGRLIHIEKIMGN